MQYKNSLIYLIGRSGVGKRTIAQEICRAEPYFKLYDNHTINNVIFPFVRHDGKTSIPNVAWDAIREIRKIALHSLVDFGDRDFSYVFTNHLDENNRDDAKIYTQLESAAEHMQACFIPVRLLCAADEHKKRIVSEGRNTLYKVTNPEEVERMQNHDVYKPLNKNMFELDVTQLSPRDASRQILDHVKRIYVQR